MNNRLKESLKRLSESNKRLRETIPRFRKSINALRLLMGDAPIDWELVDQHKATGE